MNTVTRPQTGFTLVELMIVVAVIGILAAISIPAYNDYVTRSQVIESVELFAGVRTAVTDYGSGRGSWPTAIKGPLASTSSTEINGTVTGKYSAISTAISGTYPSGTLAIRMTQGRAFGTEINFVTSDGGVTWSCTGGTTPSKFRPQACR